jgi:hypothetical protein
VRTDHTHLCAAVWAAADGTLHAILHDEDECCPPARDTALGKHAFSVDGHQWHLSNSYAYNGTIAIADGSVRNVVRRERPHMVLAADHTPLYLTNGCQPSSSSDATFTLAQPIRSAKARDESTAMTAEIVGTRTTTAQHSDPSKPGAVPAVYGNVAKDSPPAVLSAGSPAAGARGPLQSAFVDVYTDQLLWTRAEWLAELTMVKAAGVDEIIVAGIARIAPPPPPPSPPPPPTTTPRMPSLKETSSSSASASTPQPSSGVLFLHTNLTHPLLKGLPEFPDVMDNIVGAATDAGLTVVIGLARAGYSALPSDRLYIGAVAAASTELLREVERRYRSHSAVRGVYLPQELANGVCDPGVTTTCTVCCTDCTCCFEPEAARQTLVSEYLGPLSRQAKAASNGRWLVWTAPDAYLDRACPPQWQVCNADCRNGTWCGSPPGTFMLPDAWADWWARTLADVPTLDVIAHQDGVGNHNSLANTSAFFAALRRAVHAAVPPRQLWSDLEAFAIAETPPPPGFPVISEAVGYVV